MVVRKRRKKNRMRGSRTHGGGDTKKNRGSGSRGGVGFAGSHKHKFSKYYVKFGTKKLLKPKKKEKAVPIWRINQIAEKLVKEGKAKKEGDAIIIDCKEVGINKVIGPGKLDKGIVLKNASFSKKLNEEFGENKEEGSEEENE